VNYWLNIRMTKTVADFGSSEPPPHGEPRQSESSAPGRRQATRTTY
jgi:hypothetical protein